MKIKVKLSIGYPGAIWEDTIDVDDEEIEGLSSDEVEEVIDEAATSWAANYIEISARIVDDS